MQLVLRDDLLLTHLWVHHQGRQVEVADVVVDTGSAATLLAADAVAPLGIIPAPDDLLYTIRGVGGTETVFVRQLDRLQIGDTFLDHFAVEIGGMDYGLPIKGILGLDFLLAARAIIDLSALELNLTESRSNV